MKKINLGNSGILASNLALGVMRIFNLDDKSAKELIETAWDLGINFYDHADIYGDGESQKIFGRIYDKSKREQMIIQTKCGINGDSYNFSKEHILKSVDNSLKSLQTDYVDILLLHRPDALVEPEEVAEAFNILQNSGKVRNFGVSNQNFMQMELLKKYVNQKLIVNQMQFSLCHTPMIDAGINVNTWVDGAINRDGFTLDYCRLNDITIQAWSPFQYGVFEGIFIDNDKFPALNVKLAELAEKYNVSKSAISLAFIMRHPAKIQTIVGTTNKNRLKDFATANNITLTREEWYELYLSAGNILP